MKAITIQQYGNPDVLRQQEIDIPTVSGTQVLVEMHATSINPIDHKFRSGEMQDIFPVQFPHVLGLDIAGVVKAVGSEVTHFKPGDRVYGVGSSGSYAEYTVADEGTLAKISPDHLFTDAGALPIVAITAWQGLFNHGKIKQGDKVLIHAGAGGVGHIAIQLAKQTGAYVITTASASNHDFVKQLGADEVIDYTTTDFSEQLTDVDVVLDTMGWEVQEKSFPVIKEGGKLIALPSPIISDKVKNYPIVAEAAVIQPNRKDFEQIERWVREQKLKVHINTFLPFTEQGLIEGHHRIGTKHTNGKLVVQIKS
ncbi:NADPH:quinone reductase [Paenibacillus sp. yr247]|uniref:NADP-dependent oxidoreductase n=1 Tax=Paenibacillus sp. yr247 TaxID=1761880 RepID=UPI0008921EA6|nr:NADP-dependent oxidoreductase [Paenibacillus sp. yr247]SDO85739.1 NADPH:quinone reductase [Paenibacillus sp. yr247]